MFIINLKVLKEICTSTIYRIEIRSEPLSATMETENEGSIMLYVEFEYNPHNFKCETRVPQNSETVRPIYL